MCEALKFYVTFVHLQKEVARSPKACGLLVGHPPHTVSSQDVSAGPTTWCAASPQWRTSRRVRQKCVHKDDLHVWDIQHMHSYAPGKAVCVHVRVFTLRYNPAALFTQINWQTNFLMKKQFLTKFWFMNKVNQQQATTDRYACQQCYQVHRNI